MTTYATPPRFDPSGATTIMAPPGEDEGYWIGAPCVCVHDGETYLAVRERTPEDRGHAVVIHRRTGETTYETVTRLSTTALGVVSVERPALVTDPDTGDLRMYLPVDHGSNEWTIQQLAPTTDPDTLDPSTARTVLASAGGGSDRATVKDPYVVTVGGRYYMFYAGHDGRSEQAHLATSVDGDTWRRVPTNPVIERQYWHDHHTRVSCVVPAPDAPVWLVCYDGSGLADYGRTWNLRTGLAISPTLETVTDTTPAGPIYAASTADDRTGVDTFATCRYVDLLRRDGGWEVFAEVARPDGAFELRWDRVSKDRN